MDLYGYCSLLPGGPNPSDGTPDAPSPLRHGEATVNPHGYLWPALLMAPYVIYMDFFLVMDADRTAVWARRLLGISLHRIINLRPPGEVYAKSVSRSPVS